MEAFDAIDRVWDGAPALLGRGQWDHDNRVRLGFLRLDDVHPRMLWNGYVTENEASQLRTELAAKGRLDDGCFDFMFATDWKVAWTVSADRIEIYSRGGLCGIVSGDHVERPRGHRIPKDEIAEVRGEGGAFRARTRVCLRLKTGREMTIVSAYDPGAVFSDDPWEIYEAWPHRLAEEINRRLRAPG